MISPSKSRTRYRPADRHLAASATSRTFNDLNRYFNEGHARSASSSSSFYLFFWLARIFLLEHCSFVVIILNIVSKARELTKGKRGLSQLATTFMRDAAALVNVFSAGSYSYRDGTLELSPTAVCRSHSSHLRAALARSAPIIAVQDRLSVLGGVLALPPRQRGGRRPHAARRRFACFAFP